MRVFLFSILILLAAPYRGQAQLIKQLGQQAKERIKARAERKAYETIDRAIDSISAKPKNKEQKNTPQEISKEENKAEKTAEEIQPKTDGSNADMEPKDGYIQADVVPTQTLVGAPLLISGETRVSDKFKEIVIEITPPPGTNEKASTYHALINKNDGSFKFQVVNTIPKVIIRLQLIVQMEKHRKNYPLLFMILTGLMKLVKK